MIIDKNVKISSEDAVKIIGTRAVKESSLKRKQFPDINTINVELECPWKKQIL